MSLHTRSFDIFPASSNKLGLKRNNTISEFISLNSHSEYKNLKSVIQLDIHMAKDMACLGEFNKGRAVIQGIVKLNILKELIINEFSIDIVGECKIKQSAIFNKTKLEDEDDAAGGNDVFLNFSQVIVNNEKPMRFAKRQHYLPFEFLINDDLPTTYNTYKAKISYYIQINIKSQNFTPIIMKYPFRLIRCWLSIQQDLRPEFPYEQIIHVEGGLLIKISVPKLIFPNEKYANIKLQLEKLHISESLPKLIKFSILQNTKLVKSGNIRMKSKEYLIRNLNLFTKRNDEAIRLDTLLWIFNTRKIKFTTNSKLVQVQHFLKIKFKYPIYRNKSITSIVPVQLQAYPKEHLELGNPPTYIPPPNYSL